MGWKKRRVNDVVLLIQQREIEEREEKSRKKAMESIPVHRINLLLYTSGGTAVKEPAPTSFLDTRFHMADAEGQANSAMPEKKKRKGEEEKRKRKEVRKKKTTMRIRHQNSTPQNDPHCDGID